MKKLPLILGLYLMAQPLLADITLEDAYIPPAPPASKAMAAYLTITNDGSEPRTVVGVESPAFAAAHLHQTELKDGVSSMKMLHHLMLKPGESITLEPGGLHIMLMKPDADALSLGAIPLTLQFKDGDSVELDVPIRAIN